MRIKSLLLSLGVTAFTASAQQIITQWNFNGTADTASPLPSLGSGTASLIGGTTATFASGSGSTDPVTDGDNAWNTTSYPAQGTAPKTAGVQFAVPTTGFENIQISFDFRSSNTGNRRVQTQYSVNGTDFTDAESYLITVGAAFTNGLSLNLVGVAGTANNPSLVVRLVSNFDDGAQYVAVSGNYGTTGTWRFDMVTVSGTPRGSGPEAPTITAQPQSLSVEEGQTANFAVTATGNPPPAYQWLHAGTNLPGATAATLRLANVTSAEAGEYRVRVANSEGERLSDIATLTVTPKPGPVVKEIAFLRTLVDTTDYLPSDTTTIYSAEGIVTTHVNLTGPSANVLFYFQDATAGIAAFWTGGTNVFVPKAGDKVRVTAPLGHFNGLLQFVPNFSNSSHKVELISEGNPLPTPLPLNFGWQNDPAIIEPYEGRYVVAQDVYIDSTSPTFPRGQTVVLTSELGETMNLFCDTRTDIPDQKKPEGAVAIYGVLGQYDTANPRTGGYQIIPTRFADIVSPNKAPTVKFTNVLEMLVRPGDAPTNTYSDHALRTGEKLTMTVTVTDPESKPFQVQTPVAGLPASARWEVVSSTATEWIGKFIMQPVVGDAGQAVEVKLFAWNTAATNAPIWKVYVPTPAEQQIVITEYLANPATTNAAAHFNPLRRAEAPPQPSLDDEYVEIVNYSGETVDLINWTLYDSNSPLPRFRFYDSIPLSSSNVVVAYGGPLNGFVPGIPEPAVPSQEGTGIALNNAGDIIMLRNADGNLVIRVVYSQSQTSPDGSMTRYPDINSAFVPQAGVSALLVTPGRQYNGKQWTEPGDVPVNVSEIAATLNANGSVTISWAAQAGVTYTVRSAASVTGSFTSLASGITGGSYTDNALSGVATRFYRVSAP